MPTPITWRNVRINSGAGAAALGNTAAGFGRNAVAGLATFSDQMQERVTLEDERLTNEAISAALSGGPQVSGNRRVDASALQSAVESKTRLGEFQQTSDLTQIGLGQNIERDQFILDNQDEVFKLDKRATELGMDADEASIALTSLQTTAAKYDFKRQKELNTLDDTQRVNSEGLDAFAQSYENQVAQQILSEQGIANPTQDDLNRVRVTARSRMQGPEGRQAARQEMIRLGASERAWNASSWGRRDVLAEATETALTKSRAEARDKRIELEGIHAVNMREGDFSSAVADPQGNLTAGSKAVLDAQKRVISNPTKALQHLSKSGVNISDLSDDDKDLIEQVRAAFPTSSLFTPVVQGFIDERGNLDRTALSTALRTGQRDIMLAQANLSAGPQTGGARTGGVGGGGREPGLRTPASVSHAASTPEQAESDLQQLAQDVKSSMDNRLAKLQSLQTDDKRVQDLANQFAGIFSEGKDPGKPQQIGGFLGGAILGASDEPLTTKQMQKKFKEFDNWFKNVQQNKGAGSAARTDKLLQRILGGQ